MQRVYGGIGMNPVGRGGADEGGRRELTPGFPVEWHRVSQPASQHLPRTSWPRPTRLTTRHTPPSILHILPAHLVAYIHRRTVIARR